MVTPKKKALSSEKPYAVLRVVRTTGFGRRQEVFTGETLLETDTFEEALQAVRKMGGRVIVKRTVDDVTLATRLKAPGEVKDVENENPEARGWDTTVNA